MVYSPVIDKVTLSGFPWELIAAGEFHKDVGIIVGASRDELSGFMLRNLSTYPATMTEYQFDALLQKLYPAFSEDQTAQIKEAYTRAAGYDYPDSGSAGACSWRGSQSLALRELGKCAWGWKSARSHRTW